MLLERLLIYHYYKGLFYSKKKLSNLISIFKEKEEITEITSALGQIIHYTGHIELNYLIDRIDLSDHFDFESKY